MKVTAVSEPATTEGVFAVGKSVRFRTGTGEQSAGIVTRLFPEHNAIGVNVPEHREVVVHTTNVLPEADR